MASPQIAPVASLWSSACEFPVGAFITEVRHIQGVSTALREAGIKRSGTNVTPFHPDVYVGDDDDDVEFIRADGAARLFDAVELFAVHVVGVPSTELLDKCLRAAPAMCHAYAKRLRLRDRRCWAATAQTRDAVERPRLMAASSSAQPTFIELFAGIGMFRLAGEACGARCVFASEIAPAACAVYARNYGDPPSGDISEFPADQLPSHDVLTAGFPCQSFSCAGEERNFADERGQLFFEVCRVLRQKQPKAFLLENVANMVDMDDGRVFAVVLSALRDCGYRSTYRIIDSALVVPQRRRRVYIVGFLASQCAPALDSGELVFDWPAQFADAASLTTSCVADILEEHPSPDLRLTEAQYALVRRRGEHAIAKVSGHARTLMGGYKRSYPKYSEFVPLHAPTTVAAMMAEQHTPLASDASAPTASPPGSNDTGSPSTVPLEASSLSVPLRFYSVRECARLQGIPDSFSFEPELLNGKKSFVANAAYKLIGNAVSPRIVQPILASILTTLSKMHAHQPHRLADGLVER